MFAVERPCRVVDEVRLRLGDAVRSAFDAAAGDEDRIPRSGVSELVRPRIAPPALSCVSHQPTAAADPGDASVVDVHVVRVVGQPVVAAQVDRVGEHDRAGRVPQVGDPDRPAVAAAAGRERAERRLVVAAGRAARPDVVALVDAADGVARGQVDEVTHLLHVLWIGVRDDVETGAAARQPRLRAEGADARAAHLVDVVVTRVERADDQVSAHVDVHVLVLPVTVRAEDLGRLERVEQPRAGRIADVEGLEAEAAGEDQHVPAANLVELALDDLPCSGHTRNVLERRRNLGARWRLCLGCGRGPDPQDAGQDSGDDQPESHHDGNLPRSGSERVVSAPAVVKHAAQLRVAPRSA